MNSSLSKRKDFINFTAIELMVPEESISFETNFRDISTWSSLTALLYISRINEEIDVLISSTDLASAKTLDDIYQIVISRSNGII
ncbi:acyl carrier protein [Flavobacterium sp. 123]|jgi:acyl carrier protein|uniref:acyl carrier protein n=1 Tax=Flavobacterium sp. 123 TaxID=2135627 RepID=UPI000EAD5B78|nr:acyl carrier protein [Flavobacterium sp. 123]RKS99656.1 phosphopantetheine binding protein [Flavobacterium sp. 123]